RIFWMRSSLFTGPRRRRRRGPSARGEVDGRPYMSKLETGKERFAEEALRLKKAWLLCAIWLEQDVAIECRSVPAYKEWPRKRLQQEVGLLQDDFETFFSELVIKPDRDVMRRAARWMADQFDRWQK